MTESQLALYTAILVIWILLGFGLLPWVQGRALRRELRIIGYVVLAILLFISLHNAPSFGIWLEYTGIAFMILIVLWAYGRWATRYEEQIERA